MQVQTALRFTSYYRIAAALRHFQTTWLRGNEAQSAIFLGGDIIDGDPLLNYEFSHTPLIRDRPVTA